MVYHWALLAGLKAASRQTTHLDRVYDIRQRENKSLTSFFREGVRGILTIHPHGP